MRSNYRPIGEFIQLKDERNTGLKVKQLLGLSISKQFIPSVANIVGTDMENYKIIRKNQFACSTMQVRRDKKMPVALLKEVDEAIISQAYPIFEVKEVNQLLPDYLMMWFTRSEFDREACFNAVGGVRGSLEWEDFCNLQLPIPSITKQHEIVKEYNVVQNRITLNQQLIQKLEETAQVIYKQWFVEFEFPDENGLPYKANGGEMVESELGEIPKGWEVKVVGDAVECNVSTFTPKDKFKTIEYLDTSSITNNEIEDLQTLDLMIDEIPSRAKRKVNHNDIIFSTVRPNLKHFGILKNPKSNMIVSTGFAVLKPIYPNVCGELLYLLITNEENLQILQARAEMSVSTYPSINSEDLLCINFLLPEKDILKKAKEIFKSQFDLADEIRKENKSLRNMKDLLLSKLATIEN
ncbi:MAG: restriction endonuclease subunit S [Bacteroidia bacterium]|nr:restriction endonuclease subunit S [Bacteroidia bacterium]